MRLKLIAACLTLSSVVFISAQPGARGRKLTAEDYYRIKTVGGPQLSPDGKWVVFTVSTKFEEDNTTGVETYVVRSDGSTGATSPRKIQHDASQLFPSRRTLSSPCGGKELAIGR